MSRTSAKKRSKCIIGIDEVGRGPLAGPVTVAAAAIKKNQRFLFSNPKLPMRDSKKLSKKQREEWFDLIKKNKISFAISNVSPKIIDKINISNAANLAATRCIEKLINKLADCRIDQFEIYLDGGLYIDTKKIKHLKTEDLKMQTVVRGDEKIPAISFASIIAKVSRDKLMSATLNKKYPMYCFDKHKGYGTKLHYKKIKQFGISKIHRKSFL